jgi:hypothetical protein
VQVLRPTNGVRVLAALLSGGGIVGACIILRLVYPFAQKHWLLAVVLLPGMALFVWSTIVGIRLWRGVPAAMMWARVLFALQIPVVTVRGFDYEYFTGLASQLLHGPGGTKLAFRVGASISTEYTPGSTRFIVGVNLVAIGALLFLLTRPNNRWKGP